MKKTIGYVGVDLESREFIMRCEETNFGNMICDLMRTEYFTDFSMCNSGSFRKDAVIKQGPISLLYIQESFPFNDPTMVLRMNGQTIKDALEHAISSYPAEEPRFP